LADRASGQFANMDVTGFNAAHAEAHEALGCLQETILGADAAAFYRLEALHAFLARDEPRIAASFRAARTLQPDYRLSERLAPTNHPLRAHFDSATPVTDPVSTPLDAQAQLYVDGVRATSRPMERPSILQQIGSTGGVEHTVWLPPDSVTPEWALPRPEPEVNDAPTALQEPAALPEDKERRTVWPFFVGAGSAAAAATVSGAIALSTESRAKSPGTPEARLGTLQKRANNWGYAAQATGIAAVGLGVTGVVLWTR